MTINKKLMDVRKSKKMSQAELAYKLDCSIEEIKWFETNGTQISGFLLLKILSAFNLTVEDFEKYE